RARGLETLARLAAAVHHRGVHAVEALGKEPLPDAADDLVLRAEVVIEAHHRDAGFLGNAAHAQCGDSLLPKEVRRDFSDAAADFRLLVGRAPGPPRGAAVHSGGGLGSRHGRPGFPKSFTFRTCTPYIYRTCTLNRLAASVKGRRPCHPMQGRSLLQRRTLRRTHSRE